MDILSLEQRTRAMRGSKGKDTKPEILIRKGIHAKGFRYKLHDKNLPGKPDIVLPKYKAVIEVRGCYWHAHGCRNLQPSTNKSFWKSKFLRNQERDAANDARLIAKGWRLCIVWECAIRSKKGSDIAQVHNNIATWLNSSLTFMEIEK